LEEAVAGDDIAALVEAQSRLLATLSRQVAESINLHSQKTNDNG
jgi:uncharacterized lipoprotein YmbA